MQRSLVMTVIGKDRPGLVESVASMVARHGGNWLESRMSRLGGQFAGIVHVAVPTDRESSLVADLQSLGRDGLTVVVKADQADRTKPAEIVRQLEVVGQDRPGIVSQITQALAGFGVNVEELETECASAAMSGEMLFKARARLSIPHTCNLSELRRTLEKIASDLIVDVSLEPAA
ncbi:MAG TPA: ACT domain-containing protein [Verrucomicrobiae bacterium]|nr:ACT domain-containing protein [Verrucomicrobiae bacterium]